MDSNNILFGEFPQISKEEWVDKISTDLKGADYNKRLVWHFDEKMDIQPFYMAEDTEAVILPTKNQGDNNWEIREEIHFKEIEEAHKKLERGAESLILKGFDLDDNNSAAKVMDALNPEETPVHFTSVYSYPKLLTKLKKEAAKRELSMEKYQGSFDFDYYSYYLFRKEFYHSFEANRRELKVLMDKAMKLLPHFKVINVNAKHYHNAGATMIQEMAFGLAHGAEYLTDCTEEGMSIDNVLPRMQFTFAIGSSYFPEIAKIRALRFLWNRIAKQFNPSEETSTDMFIHSTSSSWNKAVYDPHSNLLRTTTETMSAVIGGCDATTIAPLDSQYKQSDSITKRIARNQQIILKEEVHLWKVIDPSKGSYYIENLTKELIEKVWDLFLEINKRGGYRAILENGFLFEEIEKSAAKKDMDIAMRRINILGVNQFPNINERKLSDITTEKWPSKGGLKTYRGAEAIEELRLITEKYIQKGNKIPLVFLLTIGDLNMRKARANFAYNFFGCAGFEVQDNNGFETINEGMNAAEKAKADLVVICSSDDEYLPLVKAIKDQKEKIVIAGSPKDMEAIIAEGIHHFIHTRSHLLNELKSYQSQLGI